MRGVEVSRYYCPKCDSEDIDVTCLGMPSTHRVSMDSLPETYGTVRALPAVMRIHEWVAVCRACGYEVRWEA